MDKIDIVVPWVDGSDPEWQAEKKRCYEMYNPPEKSNSNIRFQSWDNMHYWFRAIEKFMPWVNNIFFITWGHVPDFLDTDNSRIKVIKHSDYMPAEYLPTFNSTTIELNLHRIEELSENFVYFNDDVFPLQPIDESYYFQNDMVCDEAVEGHISPVDTGLVSNMAKYTQVNDMIVINKHFKKREVQQKNYEKWFCDDYGELIERTKSLAYWYDFAGFRDPHMANAFKKSTFKHLWEVEEELLHTKSMNRFRTYSDVTQYLARYWQICEGNFVPRRTQGKFFTVDINNYKEIAQQIWEQKYQMISINENCTPQEFELIKEDINKAFEHILPDKCSYEK